MISSRLGAAMELIETSYAKKRECNHHCDFLIIQELSLDLAALSMMWLKMQVKQL